MQASLNRHHIAGVYRIVFLGLFVAASLLLGATPSSAAMAAPAAAPAVKVAVAHDPSANVVLASLIKKGAKAYYLGTTNGLDGWLLTQGNQVQLAYAADNNSLVIGMLFGADGHNISSEQIKTIVDANPDLKQQLDAAMEAANKNVTTNKPEAGSVGDRLMADLNAAPGVTLGAASAPEVLMVMDVDCPHCKATWRALRDYVTSGKVRLRMVPVGEPRTDHQTQGALLLQAADPLTVWDHHVAGDKAALTGIPDEAHLSQIMSNNALIIRWHIATTPYLVYRARDGKVKIIQGEPNDPASFVATLAP
ncbi:MAG: thioredoxin domain-containing protein [Alphaproteobacteria bacterium]|nr:thioredoxin domain-containing protein [Alphaproteobacteria bacterium]MBV8548090.1 thioredoxin domain-containing protein [Alphaproteobacteria bacterium]